MSRCIQKKKALIFPRKINTLCINRYSFFPLQFIMVQHTVSMIHTTFFPDLSTFKNQTFRKAGFSSVYMSQKAQNDIFHLLLPVLRFRLFCVIPQGILSYSLLSGNRSYCTLSRYCIIFFTQAPEDRPFSSSVYSAYFR